MPVRSTKTTAVTGPYFRRIHDHYKRDHNRQLPFLEVSKVPSFRPPIPDPRDLRLRKIDLARELNYKVGDRVQVLYGSEKGKQGVIEKILTQKNQVIVGGVYMKRSFWHPEPGPGRPSIVSIETPIHITNVVLLDPVTKQPTRVKRRYMMDGECVRISKVSGSAMPDPVPVGRSERERLFRLHQVKALEEPKQRRGPAKDDVFGDRDHFRMLVRITRDRVSAERAAAASGSDHASAFEE